MQIEHFEESKSMLYNTDKLLLFNSFFISKKVYKL